MSHLAQRIIEFIVDNELQGVVWAIVVIGGLIYGFRDLRRFSLTRAWAISGVCFAESIRRWVILIPILAIVGVLGISQFIRGGEEDILRQTIKYSLFATGMVVTITAVLLACTNLPREIDNRVIYTIVTKPTTRLEIVIGKVMGFAKVSLLILVIMGLFTFGFVHLRAWGLQREIKARLDSGTIEPLSRPTYEYWARQGLLSSRSFERPRQVQVLAREPVDSRRWFFGSSDGEFIIPFLLDEQALTPAGVPGALPGDAGLLVHLHVGFDHSLYFPPPETGAPAPRPTTRPTTAPTSAQIVVQFLDAELNGLIDYTQVHGGRPIDLTDPTGATPTLVGVTAEGTRNLLRSPLFFVSVTGGTPGMEFSIDTAPQPRVDLSPVSLIVNGATQSRIFGPVHDGSDGPYRPAAPLFRGKGGLFGQTLRGGNPERSSIAHFEFRNSAPKRTDGEVPFELKMRIELSSAEGEEDDLARFQIYAWNRRTGQKTPPMMVSPESNRTTHFTLPAAALAGGDFDICVRNLGTGHFATIEAQSLQMVASEETFDGNLVRSLGILWMMSILVVVISICCSTFLSWPIAIVLTLLLLLGHWGIMQVSDSLAPGIGNQVAQEVFGVRQAGEARVVSAYVEAMSRVLNRLAKILPDISKFAAVEDIEKGITIAPATLLAPLGVLAAFGLPMLVMSYVFLRNKEVAP